MNRATLLSRCALIALALACGCDDSEPGSSLAMDAGATSGDGGSSGPADKADTEDSPALDQGGAEPRIGGFDIKLVAPVAATGTPGFTSVLGKVYDAPLPSAIVWEVTDSEAGCDLLEPRVPFCDPPCVDAVCSEDDLCTPNPTPQNVGKVQITGLRTAAEQESISMEPLSAANVYQPSETLPYPAFEEGREIRLEAQGGDYEPFSIASSGISPLEIVGDTAVQMDRDKPMSLEWKKAEMADIAHIHIKVDISHHGGAKGKIECDVEDTGSLEIPASLITRLIDLGYSGFPSVEVTRSAVGSAVIVPGRVELAVASSDLRSVEIPGLISCQEDIDCPDGQTCQQDLKCM